MRTRTWLFAAAALVTLHVGAQAQTVAATDSTPAVSADSSTMSHAPVVSTMDRPSAAMHRAAPAVAAPFVPQSGASLRQAKAMMIVGGAAVLTGAVIGGDAGTVIMVGGAVVGLYGLYEYLK